MKALDIYDKRPEEMENYLRYYGWNFNKKMCLFATKKMKKEGKRIPQLTKELIDEILAKYNIHISNDVLYNKVYVYHMLYADLFGNAIPDEKRLAIAVKNYLDDEDGYEEIAFSRFYIDCVKSGTPIDWEEML